MVQRRVAGLLVVPTARDSSWLRTATTPLVLVDRGVPGVDADLIDIDDQRAAFDAVSHLIAHGHRRICYIGDSTAIPTSAARLRGYHDALSTHGIQVRPGLVASSAATSVEAAAAADALLDEHGAPSSESPTAIFSATTRASLGVIPILHSRARTDVAFVGLGDFAMADALVPGVSVIDHSGARVGRAAAQRLLARLGDPGLPVEHLRLSAPLISRGSGELRP
jgi:LacI family transcriptional regulator